MKRIWIAFFIGLVGSAMICASVWAQATAQISGTVRDQSGAVLPGVEVTATQTETGIARMTVSNETGTFVLPNLPLGPYRFEAALPGFRTFVQTGIVLQVNSNPVINPILEVGQVTEQVEVQANASLVETRSTAVGQVMETERILELPLQGRQVTDLITLAGAAVETGKSAAEGWNKGTTAGTFISVAGGLAFGVMYSLDGAMHNNGYDGTSMPMPFPDALQEFKVDASGFGAAGGTRGSGGQVNAVTRSGTNEFHGNLFEFVRNYKFNARNSFATKRDTLKRNQFGGTLGGPVVKNKLFFFAAYQGTKTSTNPSDSIDFVPTPAVLAGDWTTFASPACNSGKTIALTAPFTGNRIDPALYSKAALAIASKLPPAQNECGKIVYSVPDKPNEYQIIGKGDYQHSAKHSIFGRYVVTSYKSPHPYTLTNGFFLALEPTDNGGNSNLAQSYALGSTYLVSASTVNAFRLTVNRAVIGRPGVKFFSAADIGIKAYSYTEGNMTASITGGFGFGARSFPAHNTTDAYQLSDDVNIVKGTHQLTIGGNFANWRTYQRCHTGDQGSYNFNGQATGLGMADFLTGKLTSLNQLSPVQWSSRQWYVASYLQDVWKATSKLTVNAGLRWEPYLPLAIGFGQGSKMHEGAMYNFSEDRFVRNVKSTIYPNAPAGLLYPGDPDYPNPGPNFRKWWQFAPKVGLAWDVTGDGRTSVRTSYGLAYDFSGSLSFGGSSSAPPWGFGTTVNSPAGGFEDPWRDYPGGNPFPYVRLSKWPTASQYYFVQNVEASQPTVQTWSLSLQRQLPASFVLTTSYLGNSATHLWVEGNVNRAVFFPGSPVNGVCTAPNGLVLRTTAATCSATSNTEQRRRLLLLNPQEGQFYGNMATREDSGTANYHGLLASIQRRASRGVNLGANYTWSHCIGDAATANATGRGGAGYLDPNDRSFDRGNCGGSNNSPSQDRRHIFNVTAVASTPQFANTALRRLASNWQLSTIYRVQSGTYLSLLTGLDRVLSGQAANQRPVQIMESPYLNKDGLNYLNPAAFVQPASGTFGNMRRANIQGPGFWQLDMGLTRSFQVKESQKLEFRAEAFNVTNSLRRRLEQNADVSSLTLNSNIFGQITRAYDGRIMQFALKYSF
jgi:hypothetical protein